SIREAEKLGLATRSEVFADRTYQSDGSLTPRSSPGALIEDEQACVRQVQEMIRNGRVISTAGSYIPMLAQTICLHGDGENAVAFARLIHNVVNT
ncbi:MAG: LamB/YcsF family protein, partial [Bacteroidota bacterium]